ncbi:MAG: PASTA domain-containing protein [Armatimonadota bacterium]
MAVVSPRPSDRLFDVYEARDRSAGGRLVLLWVLSERLRLDEHGLQQIARDSEKAGRLAHPHIASVFETGIDHGRFYVLTELLDCETLDDRLAAESPVPTGEALRLAMHLCEALCYAHERGIVHGALSTGCLKLPDDGAVKVEEFATIGALARTEATSGYVRRYRAAFISPEQARGAVPSPASDVYALGVILFRMLSGRLPFAAHDPLELARAHCVAPVPSIHEINPMVPPPVARLVARTLAKDPEERYPSAKDLLADLRQLAPREASRPATRPSRSTVSREEVVVPVTRWSAVKMLSWALVRFVSYLLLSLAGAIAAVTLVFVWLFSTPRQAVTVPDVVGMRQDEAGAVLRSRGLGLAVVDEVYSPDVPPGRIARMIGPYAGKRVREGRKVRVAISKGSRGVQLPAVTDMTLEDARTALEKAGLAVGPVRTRHSSVVRRGRVIRQSPAPGAWVQPKTPITLYVSEGPPSRVELDPDSQVTFRISVTVPGGRRGHRVRIEAVDTEGRRHTVHDELHLSGQHFEKVVSGRGWVLLRIYVDNEIVREVKPAGE